MSRHDIAVDWDLNPQTKQMRPQAMPLILLNSDMSYPALDHRGTLRTR